MDSVPVGVRMGAPVTQSCGSGWKLRQGLPPGNLGYVHSWQRRSEGGR